MPTVFRNHCREPAPSSDTKPARATATNDLGFVILPDGTRYTIAVFIKDSAENPETNARIIADISETVYRYVHDEYRENDIRPGKKHVDQGAGIGFESDYFY